MSSTHDCDVLIVGGGPTGLMLANCLRQYGAEVRVLERHPAISREDSRCTTIHARVLELLEEVGVLERLAFERHIVHGLYFRRRQHGRWRPFIAASDELLRSEGVHRRHGLSVQQWKIEEALLAALRAKGGDVIYGTELLGLREIPGGVSARIGGTGTMGGSEIRCRYLVGCDGARSAVREAAGIRRIGDYYPHFFILADCHIRHFNYPLDGRHTFCGDRFLAHFGHLDAGLYRIFITYPAALVNDEHKKLWTGNCREDTEACKATLVWFQERVRDLGLPFELYDPVRFSRYEIFLGYAETARKGAVFLAGDAGHTHAPTGGQGLNTGVMDAHNLGWKLAQVVLGKAPAALLDTYGAEREPVWHGLIRKTDLLGRLSGRRSRLLRWLADHLIPHVPRFLLARVAGNFAMLNLRYPPGSLVTDAARRGLSTLLPGRGGVAPGLRAPDGLVQWLHRDGSVAQQRLHELTYGRLRRGDYNVLWLCPQGADPAVGYQAFQDLARAADGRYGAVLAWWYVLPPDGYLTPGVVPVLTDCYGALQRQYGTRRRGGLYVVRPDGFIGYRGALTNHDTLHAYLAANLLAQESAAARRS